MNPAPLFRRAGLFWLALGLGLSWLAALALCRAEAWGAAWQSLSRAGTECLAFGWASLAGAERGLAIACPQPWGPWRRRAFLAAWLLWNLGLLLQLAGGRAEFLFLGSAALLFLGAWTARRAAPELSAAEAWALAAFAALPLLLLARALPASPFGLGAAVAAGWAEGAFFGLWLVPLALAVVYDGWPAAPVPCRGPAALALAAWLLGAGALGGGRFVGGPVPLWIGTVGAAASLFLLIPALALGLSLAEAAPRAGRRALGWALAAGALWVLGGVFLSLRSGRGALSIHFLRDGVGRPGPPRLRRRRPGLRPLPSARRRVDGGRGPFPAPGRGGLRRAAAGLRPTGPARSLAGAGQPP
ncbi:MAG: hypothetical protein PW734_03065 [Verrucomicrobium sp.]|nr:hypothetical protein [Verrucomicrobium sp.]